MAGRTPEIAIQTGNKGDPSLKRRVPDLIRGALDGTGLEWWVETGGRHLHIRLCGRLVGIVPLSNAQDGRNRKNLNIASNVRRTAIEIRGAA